MDWLTIYLISLGVLALLGLGYHLAEGNFDAITSCLIDWLVMLPLIGRVFGWW